MSNFQKSYIDTINKYKKELKNNEEQKINNYFSDFLFDVSFIEITPIETPLWYKKINNEDHKYQLDNFSNIQFLNKQKNIYSELIGKNGFICSIIQSNYVNNDFLTGYYLSKFFIKNKKNISVYNYGCKKLQLINGILCENNKYKIKWYVSDNVVNNNYKEKYINGITNSNNINDNNVIRSIHNNINKNNYNKFDMFICDIYPKSNITLYNAMTFVFKTLKNSGTGIIRIQDPHIWHKNTTHIINFFLLIISSFKNVKFFKTPWGKRARYYIIMDTPKEKFLITHYTNLIKYTSVLQNENFLLLRKQIVDNENFVEIVNLLKNTRFDLINYSNKISKEEANCIWLDDIMELKN